LRDPRGFLRSEYRELVDQDLDWKLRVLRGASTPRATVNGRENVLMLSSNNYLGLSLHPKVRKAAQEALKTHGAGSGSVRPIAGNMDLHEELEKKLAKFKGAEASLVYQSGYMTNTGLIPQLAPDREDVIISDELNHGSIIDGVRLSHAQRKVYSHRDMDDLRDQAQDAEDEGARRILIVTDGVFSMDGDIAPLDEIVRIGEEVGATIYVDDAHGEGVLGEGGRGIVSHFHLDHSRVHVEMGTFSKAYGVVGGHISGSQDLMNFAYNKSRTWLLTGSHPPPVAAACTAAVEVLEEEPQHVERLWDNTELFRKALREMGFDTGSSETPIIPVIVGESGLAKEFSDLLFEKGVFALPIVYPMVARGQARIRTQMRSDLSKDDLHYAFAAFEEAGKNLDII